MPHIAKRQCTRFYSIQVYQLYTALTRAQVFGGTLYRSGCSRLLWATEFLSTFLMAGSWPRSSQSSFLACTLCHERKLQVRHQFMNWSFSWTFTKVLFLIPLITLLNHSILWYIMRLFIMPYPLFISSNQRPSCPSLLLPLTRNGASVGANHVVQFVVARLFEILDRCWAMPGVLAKQKVRTLFSEKSKQSLHTCISLYSSEDVERSVP